MIRHAQAGSKRIWTRLMLAGVLLGIVGISAAHMTMAAAMNSNHVATPPRGDRPSRPDQMDIRILKADSGAIRMAAIDEDIWPMPSTIPLVPPDVSLRRVGFSDFILEGRVVHQDVLETVYAEINERYGTSVPVPPVR